MFQQLLPLFSCPYLDWSPCLLVHLLAHSAIPIAKPTNRACKSFVLYGRFRLFRQISDPLALPASIGAELRVLPHTLERSPAPLAHAGLSLNSVAALL
jgi:hypothetical protein